MKKPIIGCDIDGVIVDFYSNFLRFANEHHGLSITYEESRSHDLSLCLGLPYEETLRLHNEWEKLHGCMALQPMEGAMEHIERIRQHYEIVAITARKPELMADTKEWFAKHLPEIEIHFAIGRNNRFGGKDERLHKTRMAEIIGATCLIDDNEHEFLHWDSELVKPICFAQPWNEGLAETHPHIPRLKWPEITELLLNA